MSTEEITVAEADPVRDAAPFDEIAYLLAYPDIAESVRSGVWRSAREHSEAHGQAEGRLADPRYRRLLGAGDTLGFVAGSVDVIYASPSGRCLIAGWAEDSDDAPLSQIGLRGAVEALGFTENIARFVREDVAEASAGASGRMQGFWSLLTVQGLPGIRGSQGAATKLDVSLTAGSERRTFAARVEAVSDLRLRDIALGLLVRSRYAGDPTTMAFLQLDQGAGRALIDLNVQATRPLIAGAYVARFGDQRASYEASIIVCLYGKPDFLMLQAALFSALPGFDRYEFIYVCNSPELGERLTKDAVIACRTYGGSITLVLMPGNVGFGLANNVAANQARSGRLLLVNPDVLPRTPDWAALHETIVKNLPADQTALFGVPLYYDDGALMHGGMYFELEECLALRGGRIIVREILRTEHYGKGAPPATAEYSRARAVPAVSGAFMSIDRAWFERLGGFSPEYIFGHYEDGDLCLRSLTAGKPAWIHDVPFWHLESRGSTRLPLHDGGRLVNRWNLTTRWGEFVKQELNGRRPRYFAA
jgi:GT2 family glycosyltransferase